MKMKKRTAIWAGLVATAMCVIFASSGFLFLQRNQEGFIFADQKGDASGAGTHSCDRCTERFLPSRILSFSWMNFEHRALRQTIVSGLI